MKRIMHTRRTRATQGETIVETLCAIIIAVLAAVVLATASAVAVNNNAHAYANVAATSQDTSVELKTSSAATGEGQVTFTVDSSPTTLPVTTYTADGVYSYDLK